jgi:acetylornithine deacetylase
VADTSLSLFSDLARSFRDATGRDAKLAPLTCTTDARTFHLYYDMPATCLGPLAQRIHGIDEAKKKKETVFVVISKKKCVSLDSVEEIALTYALFMADWCGLVKI